MENQEFRFLGYRISKYSFEIAETFGQTETNFSQDIKVTNRVFEEERRVVEVTMDHKVDTDTKTFSSFTRIVGVFEVSKSMDQALFERARDDLFNAHVRFGKAIKDLFLVLHHRRGFLR